MFGRKKWLSERFVTLMVIPERTRRVHKLVVPFFFLKLGGILLSLGVVFLLIVGMDYIHVLGRMAENKRLKGQNFKLQQELRLIRNKVDSMETTLDRVRNYAKKLQLLTGQTEEATSKSKGQGREQKEEDRKPAGKEQRSSNLLIEPPVTFAAVPADLNEPLVDRVARLQDASLVTEQSLSVMQGTLLQKAALLEATPTLMPIAGWLSSGFGYRRHPSLGTYRLHAGVDIAAEPGTPVRAPANGEIIFSGYKAGYGKVVVIDHGYNIRTLFAHCSKTFVNPGDKVQRRDTIAEVGATGRATGPHLHYEIRKRGFL